MELINLKNATMKKTIFGLMILALVFASSCKKSTSGNYWTIKGTTYPVSRCYQEQGISLLGQSGVNTLTVGFRSGILPTSNGTYTVNSNGPTGISFESHLSNGLNYASISGNGTQTVSVSVSGGLVTVSGSNITMENVANPSDSPSMNLNLIEND